MFFKSKINVDSFALLLLQLHGKIYGIDALDETYRQVGFNFRESVLQDEAIWEFLAFGWYSILVGLNAHCAPDIRQTIADSMLKQFYAHLASVGADSAKLNRVRQTIDKSVSEYKTASDNGPVEPLAVDKIFNRPSGVVPALSMQAFEFRIALQTRWSGTIHAVERLTRQFRIVAH